MVVVIVQLFEFAQKTTLSAVAQSLQDLLTTGQANDQALTNAVELVDATKRYVLAGIVVLSVVFGMIAAHLSLRPLREALSMQRRFISSVAHELRTPLAVLRVENEVAALEVKPDHPVHITLKQNLQEIDRITEILNNLLLFNRVKSVNISAFEMVDLLSVAETVVERLRRLSGSKGVSLSLESAPTVNVYGNRAALEQAIFNIIKNAIVYSNRGGEVALSFSEISDRQVTVVVKDRGIGIAKKDLSRIFEPFYRSARSADNREGTGIGLSLVYEIVKLHRGKIRVDSEPGVGTTFEITLPRGVVSPVDKGSESEGFTYDFTSQ